MLFQTQAEQSHFWTLLDHRVVFYLTQKADMESFKNRNPWTLLDFSPHCECVLGN